MKSFIKSKKAGIPILNEIVVTFINIIPTPIKFLLFILLISVIANFFIPTTLQWVGYECLEVEGELLLLKVPIENAIPKTISVDFAQFKDDIYGLQAIKEDENFFIDGDKRYVKIPDLCLYTIEYENETFTMYNAYMTNCTYARYLGHRLNVENDVWGSPATNDLNRDTTETYCVGDGYYVNRNNFLKRFDYRVRLFRSTCSPPTGYYYNHTVNKDLFPTIGAFTIINESTVDLIPDNPENLNYYNKLLELGAIRVIPDKDSFSNIQCKADSTPNMYFYNIEVFNSKLWIYLSFLSVVLLYALRWYSLFT
jgi:hypothetical protein